MTNQEKKTLCVNSSEDYIQLAIGDGTGLLCGMETRAERQGIVLTPKLINSCLKVIDSDLADINRLACVIGPGSFTGLRICLSILTGISMSRNIPMGGINYLDLLAHNAFLSVKGRVFVILYAKINLVYVQGFVGPDPISPLHPPKVCKLDKVKDLFDTHKGEVYVLGSGVRRYVELFDKWPITVLDPVFDRPSLESLIKYSSKIEYSTSPLSPIYLRPSDAEENLEVIAKKRGLN